MGESNASNLILLHGALGSKSQFDLLKIALRDNFTVHTLNFSGHGGLTIADSGFSLEIFENDILTYMKENHISSAHIFGYSMGGYVALSLAGNYPEIVNSVFTLATKLEWSPEVALKEQAMLNPEVIMQKVPKFAEELLVRHQPSDWKQVLIYTADFMKKLGDKNLDPDFFKKISCPVRLAVGDRDKMVSIHETMAVYKLLQKGSMSVLPDTPHPFESVALNRLVYEINQFCH